MTVSKDKIEIARRQIVEYGLKMAKDRLTPGTAGNLSIFDRESGLMAISPSGIPYDQVKSEDVVIMDLLGNRVEGTRIPSSEYALHAAVYRKRSDAGAVVHTHSLYCTILACMGEPLRSTHYALAEAGRDELPLVPYRTYGTKELADAVEASLDSESRGFLMANHGMVAFGSSLPEAYSLATTMEWCAQVEWHCLAGGRMNVLSTEEMQEVMEHYKTYGQVREDGSRPKGYNG